NERALPYIIIDPAPALAEPIRAGEFLLWPDLDEVLPEATRVNTALLADLGRVDASNIRFIGKISIPHRRALFALAVPRLVSFSLTVPVTVQPDHSLKITGATAALTVGVYSQLDAAGVEQHRQEWANAIQTAGKGLYIWRFEPQILRNLTASIDLPSGHATKP